MAGNGSTDRLSAGDTPKRSALNRVSVVVPVFNEVEHLPVCMPSVIEAVSNFGNAELIVVDNGSGDGSFEMLQRDYAPPAQVVRLFPGTISAVRNYGVRLATGLYICFIDADCKIGSEYLKQAVRILQETDAAATGSRYGIPASASPLERVWHGLHSKCRDGAVKYLPGGNFVVRKAAFEAVGGFDERLETGEDSELCQRLTRHGYSIHESQAVSAVHLGNPTSARSFLRQQIWHGLGMFGTVTSGGFDKPTAMLFVFIVSLVLWPFIVAMSLARGVILAVAVGLLLPLAVPVVSVVYRYFEVRRVIDPLRAVGLYWLYFLGRFIALCRIASRKIVSFRRIRAEPVPACRVDENDADTRDVK